jgi:hypothetical protein
MDHVEENVVNIRKNVWTNFISIIFLPYVNVAQYILHYFKFLPFNVVAGHASLGPHAIDKMPNIAYSHRFLNERFTSLYHVYLRCCATLCCRQVPLNLGNDRFQPSALPQSKLTQCRSQKPFNRSVRRLKMYKIDWVIDVT